MVTLTEVEDEHFQEFPAGQVEDDDDYSDTGTWALARISMALALRFNDERLPTKPEPFANMCL